MRLFVLTPAYFPDNGGVERHVRAVSREHKNAGIDVTIGVRYSARYTKDQLVDGIRILRLPRRDTAISWVYWSWRHKDILRQTDIFHSHDVFPFRLNKLVSTKPWVHTFHGYEGYPLDPNAIKSRKRVNTLADYTFAVGDFIEKWYGTKCDEVIYGAADQQLGKKLNTSWDIVFYGRLEKDTGFEAYLKGFKLASDERPELTMVVLGDGELMSWAKQYTIKNNLKVEFKGVVDSVYAYLTSSNIAYVSGYLGIIEAGIHKLPIVAQYNSPIKKDYLEMHPMGKNIFVVNSPSSIRDATKRALAGNFKGINQVYTWAKKQTWIQLASKYSEQYVKLTMTER